MNLRCRQVFVGGGFTIAAWMGNAGDERRWRVPEFVARRAFASSSIICRGAFGYPLEHGLIAKAGDLVNEVMPDFEPGDHVWTALADDSLELCATTSDASGVLERLNFHWSRVTGNFVVEPDSVLVVATGEAWADGELLKTPNIVHTGKAVSMRLDGAGMLLRRH